MEKKAIIKKNAFLNMRNVELITFFGNTDNMPQNVEVIDFSMNRDMSVVGWYNPRSKDNTDLCIAPTCGNKVFANKDSSYMFMNCINLLYVFGLNNLDTSNVTNMTGMFTGCTNLNGLNGLTRFNMDNVTKASCMFSNCSSLSRLNLSLVNMDKLEDASHMFAYCSMLNTLYLPKMPNVKNVRGLFYECESLVHLKASINLCNVSDMDHMLIGCPKIVLSMNS